MDVFFQRLVLGGGIINYVILAEYVIVLALIAERLVYYTCTRYNRKKLAALVNNVSDFPCAHTLATDTNYRYAAPMRTLGEFIRYEHSQPQLLNEAMQRFVESLASEMEARLDLLSLFANVAPLCGLLGTVVGLMNSFDKIQQLGNAVDVAQLAGGIWIAMITTATGLGVAIPALAACRLFELEMSKRMKDVVETVSHLKERLRPDSV